MTNMWTLKIDSLPQYGPLPPVDKDLENAYGDLLFGFEYTVRIQEVHLRVNFLCFSVKKIIWPNKA